MQNNRAVGNSQAGRQLVNSTELPGHDHATTVISKVSHRVSGILPSKQTVEEEVLQRTNTPETPDDDKISMTRVMLKSIMTKALEDQINLADATDGNKTFQTMNSFNNGKRYKK